jgi:hypothetical protein
MPLGPCRHLSIDQVLLDGGRQLASNGGSLINYGERYRAGERISSLAESSVNAVLSKRFAKRQQMQWA